MSIEFSQLPPEERALRFTALLLGELSADEVEQIRLALAAHPELARECDRLQQTVELLREATALDRRVSAAGTPLRLDDSRRAKLLETFKQPAPRVEAPRRRRWYVPASIAASLVGLLLLWLMLPSLARSKARSSRPAFANRMDELQEKMRLGRPLERELASRVVDNKFQISGQVADGATVSEYSIAALSAGDAVTAPAPVRVQTVAVLPNVTDMDAEGMVELYNGSDRFGRLGVNASSQQKVAAKGVVTTESGRTATVTVPETMYKVTDLDLVGAASEARAKANARELYLGFEQNLGEVEKIQDEFGVRHSRLATPSIAQPEVAPGSYARQLMDVQVPAPVAAASPEGTKAYALNSDSSLTADGKSLTQEGRALYEVGKSKEAQETLRKALAANPNDTAALYYNDLANASERKASARLREANSKQMLMEVESSWIAEPTPQSGFGTTLNRAVGEVVAANPRFAISPSSGDAPPAAPTNLAQRPTIQLSDGTEWDGKIDSSKTQQGLAAATSGGGMGGGAGGFGGAGRRSGGSFGGNVQASVIVGGSSSYAGVSVAPSQPQAGQNQERSSRGFISGAEMSTGAIDDGAVLYMNGNGVVRSSGDKSGVVANNHWDFNRSRFDNSAWGNNVHAAKGVAPNTQWFDSDGLALWSASGNATVPLAPSGVPPAGPQIDGVTIANAPVPAGNYRFRIQSPPAATPGTEDFLSEQSVLSRESSPTRPASPVARKPATDAPAPFAAITDFDADAYDLGAKPAADGRAQLPAVALGLANTAPMDKRFYRMDSQALNSGLKNVTADSFGQTAPQSGEGRAGGGRTGVRGPADQSQVSTGNEGAVTAPTQDSFFVRRAYLDMEGKDLNGDLGAAATGVLASDTAADGDALAATLKTSPARGTLVQNANSTFTYRPSTDLNGADSFTYRASDANLQWQFRKESKEKEAGVVRGFGDLDFVTEAKPSADTPAIQKVEIAGAIRAKERVESVAKLQTAEQFDRLPEVAGAKAAEAKLRGTIKADGHSDDFSAPAAGNGRTTVVLPGQIAEGLARQSSPTLTREEAESGIEASRRVLATTPAPAEPVAARGEEKQLAQVTQPFEQGMNLAFTNFVLVQSTNIFFVTGLAKADAPVVALQGFSPFLGTNSVLTTNFLSDVPEARRAVTSAKKNSDEKRPALNEDKALPKPPPGAPTPQPEVQTSDNAFSTFSLNVSDVSFKLAAASLEKGALPDAAGIRSEEFLNAFDYREPLPPAGVSVAFAWERARYPFAHNRDALRFSVKTAAQGRDGGRPLNIVLLIDNSGSMERADRVRIIQESLRTLAAQLQPQDKLSVVSFSRTATLRADGVSGAQAAEVAKNIAALTPEGGTNLEDALDLAYRTALRHYAATAINRVVLLTDGAANLGNVEPKALKAKVEGFRKQGVALDCFGIGWDGFNDDLLEQLSRNGDGRYGYINAPEEAATEFAGQLAGALHVAASDVKVQVEFNPKRVTAYRQVGYAKHQLTKQQFRDNTVDAAEIGASEAGNGLYIIETNPRGEGPIATVRARFRVPQTSDYREHEWVVPYGSAVDLEQSSSAMRLATSASAFSEWLASSPFSGEVTTDRLLGLMSGVPEVFGADTRPKKLEWMIRQAKSISGK